LGRDRACFAQTGKAVDSFSFQPTEVGLLDAGYNEDDALASLRRDGLPAYIAVSEGWEQRLLVLNDGLHLYIVEEGQGAAGSFGCPCFRLADLHQITRRVAPGRHMLSLQFEDGRLLIRFSYGHFINVFIAALTEERRVPVVDARD